MSRPGAAKATKERKLAAHRKSLHGRKVHEIVAVGNTVILEKISYKAWQKQYGRSVGLRAPGMFVEHLRRTWASHGRHPGRGSHAPEQAQPVLPWLREVCEKAALAALASLRLWRGSRPAGSVFCISGLNPGSRSSHPLVCPGCHSLPKRSAARLRAAHERVVQRAKERQVLPRSFGIPRAGARRPQSLSEPTQEPTFLLKQGRLEAWKDHSEPPLL